MATLACVPVGLSYSPSPTTAPTSGDGNNSNNNNNNDDYNSSNAYICAQLLDAHYENANDERMRAMMRDSSGSSSEECDCRATSSGHFVVECSLSELEMCTPHGVCGYLTLEHRYLAGKLLPHSDATTTTSTTGTTAFSSSTDTDTVTAPSSVPDSHHKLEGGQIDAALVGYTDCVKYTQGKTGKDCVKEMRVGEIRSGANSVVESFDQEGHRGYCMSRSRSNRKQTNSASTLFPT